MTLDTKLKKILREFNYYKGSEVEPDAIVQIKQAFADEGYVNDIARKHFNDAFIDGIKQEAGLMTGQEWYERFERELKSFQPEKLELSILLPEEIEANVLKAAKKASGL